MVEYDQLAMQKATLRKVSMVQQKKVRLVERVLEGHDAQKMSQIISWLRALGQRYDVFVDRINGE